MRRSWTRDGRTDQHPDDVWTALSGNDPFTVSATVTATTVIGADATIELYNDQPVAFSQYCFSIAAVSGQTLTIYALETPTSAVTLTVGIQIKSRRISVCR